MRSGDNGVGSIAGARTRHLVGSNQWARVLRKASDVFAISGLHGTTMLTLAQAAGISELDLQSHFGNKTALFREVVEINIEARLHSLDRDLALIAAENGGVDSVESMAEATMLVCLSDASNAMLMNWALLEAPEFAMDLYRNEIGSVRVLWDREVARHFPASRARDIVSFHIVPFAVNTCLAHGLWLATLRHTPESAAPLARQFAISIARSVSVTLGLALPDYW
jgi:AcrR family transcriptional regulator